MSRLRAGSPTVLTAGEWRLLVERMRGEDKGGWILMPGWREHDSTEPDCVAIMTESTDVGTLIIFLTRLVEVLSDATDSSSDLEDVRFLADQVRLYQPEGIRHPLYYLPTVTVEEDTL